jgi:hypothetical protein
MARLTKHLGVSVAWLALSLTGCDTDERLVKQAEKASDRQADQNREIARQNHELAQATNQLVAADAKARQETLALQRELQSEQARQGQKRDDLEAERRQIANQRHRDPLLAAALTDVGMTLACLLPLLLCGYLFHSLRQEPNDHELAELLTTELVSDAPMLLPRVGNAALTEKTAIVGKEDDAR